MDLPLQRMRTSSSGLTMYEYPPRELATGNTVRNENDSLYVVHVEKPIPLITDEIPVLFGDNSNL